MSYNEDIIVKQIVSLAKYLDDNKYKKNRFKFLLLITVYVFIGISNEQLPEVIK